MFAFCSGWGSGEIGMYVCVSVRGAEENGGRVTWLIFPGKWRQLAMVYTCNWSTCGVEAGWLFGQLGLYSQALAKHIP